MVNKAVNIPFVVPYVDQDMRFWEKLQETYGSKISEVYFPLLEENIGTGRPKQPARHLTAFLGSGILPVSALINPIVLHRPAEELADNISRALEYHLSHHKLVSITVTDVLLAHILRKRFPGLKMVASTLTEIYNEQQLAMVGEVFDILVPSTRIVRDIHALKRLKTAFKGSIRMMVNEGCLSSCVFRTQHFYEMCNHQITYPRSLCNNVLKQKPWLRLTGSWILPQHLDLFEGLYDEIKLSGRVSLRQPDTYFRVLDAYVVRSHLGPHEIGGGPASIGIPVEIEREFYMHTLICTKNCIECTACSNYWKDKTEKHERIIP